MHDLKRALASFLLLGLLAAGEATAQTPPSEPPPDESRSQRLLQAVQRDIATVEPLLNRYGSGAVFIAVGVEGFGIPAPGQTLLIAAAASTAVRTRPPIGQLLIIAFLAAVLGSSLGYLLGRRSGRSLLRRFRVDERHLQRVEQGFARYGGGLIVIGRFFDGLRQLNSIAAGILEMPWWTFTLYNALGAALWVGCWGLGVYYVDEHWRAILAAIRSLNPWVATITLAGTGGLILMLWRRERRRRAVAPRQTPPFES